MNVYTHVNFDDAEEELKRMDEFRKAQAEIDKQNPTQPTSQVMFKVIEWEKLQFHSQYKRCITPGFSDGGG